MLYVIKDYTGIDSKDIEYVYGDFDNNIIIDVKNNNGYEYLSNHNIQIQDIKDVYSINDLNYIISDLEECTDSTTDEDDIRSDKIAIELIKDYIKNEWGK